jgi:hypothetical protein
MSLCIGIVLTWRKGHWPKLKIVTSKRWVMVCANEEAYREMRKYLVKEFTG